MCFLSIFARCTSIRGDESAKTKKYVCTDVVHTTRYRKKYTYKLIKVYICKKRRHQIQKYTYWKKPICICLIWSDQIRIWPDCYFVWSDCPSLFYGASLVIINILWLFLQIFILKHADDTQTRLIEELFIPKPKKSRSGKWVLLYDMD